MIEFVKCAIFSSHNVMCFDGGLMHGHKSPAISNPEHFAIE